MSVLGILGGSGLYELDGIAGLRDEPVTTPFGPPSAAPRRGRLGDVEVVFLPRHGRGHRLLPSEINYRANVHAFKQLGVEQVVSISAVGSMREGIRPGDLVLPDQFIDKTFRRESTFFGAGLVGHVSFADPVCADLAGRLAGAARAIGLEDGGASDRGARGRAAGPRFWRGGTYVCMEGPQFSTRAESLLHRAWGVDVVGMTAATEAKLCREAELCFANVALATDYDCWHPDEEAVHTGAVVEVLRRDVALAKDLVRGVVPSVAGGRGCACASAARGAILTAPEAISAEVKERFRVLYGRYL